METKSICHIDINSESHMFRTYREAVSAQKAGFDVTIIAEGETKEIEGIHFVGFSKAKNRVDRMFFRSRKMIKRAIRENTDIIQIHSPELLLYISKLLKTGKIVIYDAHEYHAYQIKEKKYIPKLLRNPVSKAYSLIEKKVCSKIDCVIYPCTLNGKNYYEDIARDSIKIDNYSLLHKIDIVEKKPNTVIYAGGLVPERGIGKLAEAVKGTKAKLVLCGDFIDDGFKEMILNTCPPGQIIFKGYLSRNELFEEYSKCSIGVCTVLIVGQYGMGDNLATKMYEYMQCGLPIVFSRYPYAEEVNNRIGFGIPVDPSNPKEIREALEYLMDNPSIAEKMGENGRNAVQKVFNWEKEGKRLTEKYNQLISNRRLMQ